MALKKTEKSTTRKRKTPAKRTTNKAPEKPGLEQAGIKKEYLETKNLCRVTFTLPKVAAQDAKTVSIVGDFNDWNIQSHMMKKMKTGDFTITIDLYAGKEYQFRYLIDEIRWENDWNADKYIPSPFGDCDNSVVAV